MQMRVAEINYCDTNNVIRGVAISIWTQGCMWNCDGCFNPCTHDPGAGRPFILEDIENICNELDTGIYTTVSFLGGEPMLSTHKGEVIALAKLIKNNYPHITTMMWTGYKMIDIYKTEDLHYMDYVIDGLYDKAWITKVPLRGSGNQKLWRSTGKELFKVVDYNEMMEMIGNDR